MIYSVVRNLRHTARMIAGSHLGVGNTNYITSKVMSSATTTVPSHGELEVVWRSCSSTTNYVREQTQIKTKINNTNLNGSLVGKVNEENKNETLHPD